MFFLKEDTAASIRLGPFVDKTDGVTYEAGMAAAMDHATTGIRLSKNGGAFADRNNADEPTYDAFGYYNVNLSTTDTNTPGALQVIFGDAAVCLPCEANFQIVSANVYDALFGAGTVFLKTDLTQILAHTLTNTGTQIADAFQTMFDVSSPVFTAQCVNQAQDNATTAEIKTALETGMTFATLSVTGQLDAGNVLVDTTTALTGAVTAPTGITANITGNLSGSVGSVTGLTPATISDAVWDEAQADHVGAGTFGIIASEIADILVDSGTTLQGELDNIQEQIGVAGAGLTAINLPDQTMNITGNITGNLSGSVGSVTGNIGGNVAGSVASVTGGATAAELAKVPKSDSNVTFNATALASINAEVDTALNTAIPGAPTAASINDYIVRIKYATCNRWDILEATGALEIFDDAGGSFATIAAAFSTLAGVTKRSKIL